MAPEWSPGAENQAPSIRPCLEIHCARSRGQVGPPMAGFGEIGGPPPRQLSGQLRPLNRSPRFGVIRWGHYAFVTTVYLRLRFNIDCGTVTHRSQEWQLRSNASRLQLLWRHSGSQPPVRLQGLRRHHCGHARRSPCSLGRNRARKGGNWLSQELQRRRMAFG